VRLAALMILISASAAIASSDSSYHCPGIEPYPPVSCHGQPRCLCDADGRCG
jgi:hypothetical protein